MQIPLLMDSTVATYKLPAIMHSIKVLSDEGINEPAIAPLDVNAKIGGASFSIIKFNISPI
jgi:hypothetical protein